MEGNPSHVAIPNRNRYPGFILTERNQRGQQEPASYNTTIPFVDPVAHKLSECVIAIVESAWRVSI